jgi:peptidoglycan hydrolase CwlO-like protein
LQKFLSVIAEHQKQLEAQMTDLQANLDELTEHQREAKVLLAKTLVKTEPEQGTTKGKRNNGT